MGYTNASTFGNSADTISSPTVSAPSQPRRIASEYGPDGILRNDTKSDDILDPSMQTLSSDDFSSMASAVTNVEVELVGARDMKGKTKTYLDTNLHKEEEETEWTDVEMKVGLPRRWRKWLSQPFRGRS